jgi:phage shock protein PspC (stress-responsive transcriptional regulator)
MGVDVTLVRVIALVLLLVPPSIGLIAYIVAWIVMPNDPWVAPAPYAAPANGHA